jgi:formylglycine-generating enzyme
MQPIVVRKRVMPSHRLSTNTRRWGSLTTGALLLASCSSLLGIEDPVPRDCSGDACDPEPEGGSGGAPVTTGGHPAVAAGAGAANKPNEGGAGGELTTLKAGGGEGGAINATEVAGMGGETGGAPPQIECNGSERRCNIYQPQICVSGHWMDDGDECALACVDGACQTPASCSAEAAVAPCAEGASCCETIWVPGGTYLMGQGDDEDPDATYERTVSGFYLDRFEVTVGRFQYFQSHFVLPNEGEGAHPRIPASGWREAWEQIPHPFADGRNAVPSDGDELGVQVVDDCDAPTRDADHPGRPINCVNWFVAFAFCAFDGGRLPTEAEWNYAAAFGSAQRPYPWSQSSEDMSIDSTHATFNNYPMPSPDLPTPVGSWPLGRGGFERFAGQGHDDLAGNVAEWTLDHWLEVPPAACGSDCLAAWTQGVDERVVRGGGYPSPYYELRSGARTWAKAEAIDSFWGFRCVRDIEKLSIE